MKNLIKKILKINLWFCAGVLITDTYVKVCAIHDALTKKEK